MTLAIVAAVSSFAVLAVAFVPLERVFPARPGQRILRPGIFADACFFLGQYLVFTSAAISVLAFVHTGVAARVPAVATSLPVPVRALLAVVLGDVAVYWFHRACHRFAFLWRFHAVHHSSTHLDWLAAHREHPVDGVLTQLCQNLPGILLGVPFGALAGVAAFRGVWAIFVHSNVRLPLGPMRLLLGAPELHHWHHASVERSVHNFANLAPWLDVLFRTHHLPSGPPSYELGIPGAPPRTYVAHLVAPLGSSALWERVRRRHPGAAPQERIRRTPSAKSALIAPPQDVSTT